MELSTKSRYAVTGMMFLLVNDNEDPVPLSRLSRLQGISLSYLEQIFSKLRKAQLVESVRGPGGGYRLGKPSSIISIAQILLAIDESVDCTQGKGRKDGQFSERPITHKLWEDFYCHFYEFLSGIMLADLLKHSELSRVSVKPGSTSYLISKMFQPVDQVV